MQMETVVEEIDTKNKRLFYRRVNSKKTKLALYDKLIFATGSYPAMTSVPFDKKSKLYFLKSMDDAIKTDEYHGFECSVSGGACMYLYPDSKRCAREYGEGPDVGDTEDMEK